MSKFHQFVIKAVQFLVQRNANPHYEDKTGQDACDYAKNTPFEEMGIFQNCTRNKVKVETIKKKNYENMTIQEIEYVRYNKMNEYDETLSVQNSTQPLGKVDLGSSAEDIQTTLQVY